MQNVDQTNYVSQDKKRKIRTASLQFHQSQKSPRLPKNNSPTNSLTNYCYTHTNKLATFVRANDQLRFCEKCAISLASQGHMVSKIGGRVESHGKTSRIVHLHSREVQVEKFLDGVKSLKEHVLFNKENVTFCLIQSEQFYGQQIQQITQYFDLVIKSLELQKNKCYNYILNDRKTAQQQIRAKSISLCKLQSQINKIVTDIQQNLQTVYKIEDKMYGLVMAQYTSQIMYFQKQLNNLSLLPIQMNKIQFTGVPQELLHLSDLVINNRKGGGYQFSQSGNGDQFHNLEANSPKHHHYHLLEEDNRESCSQSLKFSFEAERMRSLNQQEAFGRYLQMNKN